MKKINRRRFVASSIAGLSLPIVGSNFGRPRSAATSSTAEAFQQPAFSITPVVGDGKWVWTDPPQEQGRLEPREFEVSVGIDVTSRADSKDLIATTVAPVQFPEQEILDVTIDCQNGRADIIPLQDSAAQLMLTADFLAAGATASVRAVFKLKIYKSYFNFHKEQFPEKQKQNQIPKQFLRNSPGIKVKSKEVKQVLDAMNKPNDHPWDKAKACYQWVWENIEGIPGKYTSVEKAIADRRGDCEERACTFIALCRAVGIPARQVWVPSHVWAEIALHDHDGIWHWIPIHTAAYNWFGWTGAHELVLQKGDRIQVAGRKRRVRLIDDWYRIGGPRPALKFTSSLQTLDKGPGSRIKRPDGRWAVEPNSDFRRFHRDT